jgi:ribosomal protein S6--L-glutamate ligase
VEATPALQDLGRRCGRLFGLDLYGVDCIETADGVLIIEINDYPNYTNVPDANAHLARYVEQRVAGR